VPVGRENRSTTAINLGYVQDDQGREWEEKCDVCIWTAGQKANAASDALGLTSAEEGKILVTPRLQVGLRKACTHVSVLVG
jgi:NADH dehydrogenase FAD-containing subunit